MSIQSVSYANQYYYQMGNRLVQNQPAQSAAVTKPQPATITVTPTPWPLRKDTPFYDPVADYFHIYSAKPTHPFAYTPEEWDAVNKYPLFDLTENLIAKKDYSRALDYINQYETEKDYAELKQYLKNPAFDSLVNSKFYKGTFGFQKLADTIYSLHKTQQDAYKKVSTPGYFCPYTPDITSMKAYIDVNQCVTNLDKFFKSGFSDELKYFIKNGTDKLSDLWYVSHNLNDIDKSTDVEDLTAPYYVM